MERDQQTPQELDRYRSPRKDQQPVKLLDPRILTSVTQEILSNDSLSASSQKSHQITARALFNALDETIQAMLPSTSPLSPWDEINEGYLWKIIKWAARQVTKASKLWVGTNEVPPPKVTKQDPNSPGSPPPLESEKVRKDRVRE